MTQEELESLEEEEHGVAIAIIALLMSATDSLRRRLTDEIASWFGKYAKDGKYTYQQARKVLSVSELRDFNKKYGTKFKRLTRQRALRYAIISTVSKLSPKIQYRFREIESKILGIENKAFGTSVEESSGIKWGADDKSADERIKAKVDLLALAIVTDVQRTTLTSGSLKKANESVNERMSTFDKALTLLLITEATAYSSAIRKKVMKALGISRYKFIATKDERTCPICSSLNGKIFPYSAYEVGVTASPIHPRCRCIEVPLFE